MVPEPIELEINGTLDLHMFHPKEVKSVVLEYIEAALEKDVFDLRIVHGKGVGNLRRTVHSVLKSHPAVVSFKLGGAGGGSWGATLVRISPPDSSRSD
ncbi:MAG: Smr/MutS family protein [Candidatus Eisenbacteria bacterium]|uniref:Smr/MutS family protein n=1 Tax=Eiseniibacteriota bacterium TaxID=2212470 RepID=A0A7Y2H2J4_UNCEI|nr:Smr/MutS family protein [Candidatus Eisenbacteria bacterium]